MAKKKEVAAPVTENVKKASIHDFDCIIEPLITEKSTTVIQENNQYTFIVKKSANKTQIKNAIHKIYNVEVKNVNVVNVPSKVVTRGSKYKGSLSAFKKAIVTLKEGQTINLYAE